MTTGSSAKDPVKSAGFRAVRKTCSGFGERFTKGTSSIADAILDRTVTEKKERIAKVRTASVGFVKDLASGLKQDLKNVSFLDVMKDTSYQAGKVSLVVKKAAEETWNMLMEKLDEDRS